MLICRQIDLLLTNTAKCVFYPLPHAVERGMGVSATARSAGLLREGGGEAGAKRLPGRAREGGEGGAMS